MRVLAVIFATGLFAACTPAAETEWDMGPMPPVAALYDQQPAPNTADARSYYFVEDLARALGAEDSPVDFDYRSWAIDPEIENQTFGLSEHPPEDRAVVSTRFTYPGVGDGMIVEYTLCRRGPSDWQIEDVRGTAVDVSPSAEPGVGETNPGLREMLGLPERSAACD